jgi:hypothetical protein
MIADRFDDDTVIGRSTFARRTFLEVNYGWTTFVRIVERRLVDGRRLELPTSALRTRRSPN